MEHIKQLAQIRKTKRETFTKSGFGHKVPGPLEVVSRYSRLQLDASTAEENQSGRHHKAARPLEVISRYSRTSRINRPSIVPLTTHNLSLHNQAYVMKSLAPKIKSTSPDKARVNLLTFPLTPADPPKVMRESRAATHRCDERPDSGNQHASPKPHRKCRSEVARIRRKVNRALVRSAHRVRYRLVKQQAIDLASQANAFLAPEPAGLYNPQNSAHPQIQTRIMSDTSESNLKDTCSLTSGITDCQSAVLQKKHLEEFKIASLNCRGLSSASKRERIIHLMVKEKIDVLCLQETKINYNSQETHLRYKFYWSTDISDDARNKASQLAASGKAARNNPNRGAIFRNAIEHAGVGIVLSPHAVKYLISIQPVSGRNMCVSLKMRAGTLDVISTYVPQACHTNPELANHHYRELQALIEDRYTFSPKLICGDFNARLIKALPHESSAIGQFTLGAQTHDLDILSAAQLQNRSRMVEFCLEYGFVASNTLFQKADDHLITYKSVGVKHWSPPWQLHKYAQMDYIVINNRWKNAIKNIDTSYIHTVDTDHKLLIASVKFQLKANPPKANTSKMKLRKPDNIQLNQFNAAVASKALQELHNTNGADLTFDQLNTILLQSAKDYLPIQPTEQKKEYTSQRTWALLEKKWQAIENQQWDVAESISKDITTQAKKDKENHLLEELEAVTAQGYKWSGLKRLRAKFTPKFTK